jgi:hypothetical protein
MKYEAGQTVTYNNAPYVIVAWRSKGTDISDFYDLVPEPAYRNGERKPTVTKIAEAQITC